MKIGTGTGRTARWLLAMVMAFGASVAMAQAPTTGIFVTKHNLGTGGPGPNKLTGTGTTEVCVFCHTPHAADTFSGAPLWNKTIATAGATYSIYNTSSSTMDAGRAISGGLTGQMSIGSVSLACLSCHDGTQAMDNILNAPGSGGLTAGGGGVGGLSGLDWSWNVTANRVDATGTLATANVANLGKDLSNDHPIGIQYCGGGYTTLAGAGTCADGDFVTPQSTLLNSGERVFFVDTAVGTATTRQKTDMILYNREFATGSFGPSVECASCHDPHSENVTFLRIANTNSGVCLACHVK